MVQLMQELVDQIYRETRLVVEITPQTNDLRLLPLGMRSFYAFSDGLSIPFANIYPIHYFKEHLITDTYPVWFELGDDGSLGGYFCGLLSAEDCYFFSADIASKICDLPKSEPQFPDLQSLVIDAYRSFNEAAIMMSALTIESFPTPEIYQRACQFFEGIEWYPKTDPRQLLAHFPARVIVSPKDAFGFVRHFQPQGVDCFVLPQVVLPQNIPAILSTGAKRT